MRKHRISSPPCLPKNASSTSSKKGNLTIVLSCLRPGRVSAIRAQTFSLPSLLGGGVLHRLTPIPRSSSFSYLASVSARRPSVAMARDLALGVPGDRVGLTVSLSVVLCVDLGILATLIVCLVMGTEDICPGCQLFEILEVLMDHQNPNHTGQAVQKQPGELSRVSHPPWTQLQHGRQHGGRLSAAQTGHLLILRQLQLWKEPVHQLLVRVHGRRKIHDDT